MGCKAPAVMEPVGTVQPMSCFSCCELSHYYFPSVDDIESWGKAAEGGSATAYEFSVDGVNIRRLNPSLTL